MTRTSSLLAREAAEQHLLLELLEAVDGLVETALHERRSLVRAMAIILPAIAEKVAAEGVFVRTYGEDLELHTFVHPPELSHRAIDAFLAANATDHEHRGAFPDGDRVLIAQGLDVAGEWFGSAGFLLDVERASDERTGFLSAALRVVCEQLDNYLHVIRAAREKHRVLSALARALQNRVLSDGLADAVRILSDNVNIERLLIALRAAQSAAAPVHVQVYEGRTRIVDTMSGTMSDADALEMQESARAYLRDTSRDLLERLDFRGAREEVLIHGVTETTLVGKVVVSSQTGDFNTYDRDLLTAFGDFICQRLVDFNKEYRTLARSFRPADVDRMLRSQDYVGEYLEPRERNVAILFVDVSGFTRACEQILIDPKKIGRLVDAWGERAVELVWKHGGVFDKMVGDCVIGLFGPPFYDRDGGLLLANAIDAAIDIRRMTRALPELEEFALLRAEGLGVSTGVSYAPLFVGTFGPNENFTGFSAGMNNTARLQAQAGRDEILVMEDSIARLPEGHAYAFGEMRSAVVKNVAQPLQFRPLEGDGRVPES